MQGLSAAMGVVGALSAQHAQHSRSGAACTARRRAMRSRARQLQGSFRAASGQADVGKVQNSCEAVSWQLPGRFGGSFRAAWGPAAWGPAGGQLPMYLCSKLVQTGEGPGLRRKDCSISCSRLIEGRRIISCSRLTADRVQRVHTNSRLHLRMHRGFLWSVG